MSGRYGRRGLPYTESMCSFSYPGIEEGKKATHALLARGVRPEVLVCGEDVLAIGAIEACLEAGLRVPEDIRICGFDDSSMLEYLKVPLTTMRQDVNRMAWEGVRILLSRRENPEAAAEEQARVVFPCGWVFGKSCS